MSEGIAPIDVRGHRLGDYTDMDAVVDSLALACFGFVDLSLRAFLDGPCLSNTTSR